MIQETTLSRSIRLICLGGMALGMQLAQAQQVSTAAEAPVAPMQKIDVTGSRIPSLSLDGPAPVTMMSAKDIRIDGARSVEDLLNNLPQVFADQGGAVSDGATGTATVSLRGLGADRTLVLVNGKRLPSGSVNSSAADLNEIPTGLIKRVDVLTGGAGAVYGAGAVAGVVNFILKDNFEGVELQLNQSGYQHRQQSAIADVVKQRNFPLPGDAGYDGKIRDASILMGGNFDGGKGNATVYFTYKETDAVLQSARDFSACALGSDAAGFNCAGSGTQASGRVTAATGAFTNADANGTPRAYSGATDAYNYGPLNYLQRPSKVYGFNAQAHYDITPAATVYNEFNFHNYKTDAQIAPGGIFYGQTASLSYDNPLLSSAWKTALGLTPTSGPVAVTVGKRNIEGGPRIESITDTSFREVLGLKGDIANWSYDTYAQFARVTHSQLGTGYFSNAKIANALDVTTDASGNAICRSNLGGADPACVPYNLYKLGGVTQAQLDYLQVSGQSSGYTQQIIYGANTGADLGMYGIQSPLAGNGVGVSFGVEHRSEKLVFTPDYEISSGDLSGGSASPALAGAYSVKEIFGEVKVPLVEKRPYIESLLLQGSYRHSEYSTDKTANTYGIGLDWAPTKQVRLRGSYQRAVRAPTIQDLYAATSVSSNGTSDDPCTGATPKASLAACANTGVTAAQYGKLENNSANQYGALSGGSASLSPEVADTYTLGLVLTPAKDLSITIDAFKIDIDNTISTISPTVALNQCLSTGDPQYCALIHRDSAGSLWLSDDGYIVNTKTNIGSVGTSGIDLGGNYRMKIGAYGGLEFTMNGTWLRSMTTENVPGLGEYDCKGLFGTRCLTPSPEWRHKFRTTWSTPWNLDISGTWRHIAEVKNDALSDNALLAGSVAPVESRLGARDYIDLNAAYQASKQVSLSLGISNLFDRDPPIVSTNATPSAGVANGNTYPQVYDSYGRRIYLNMTARF